MMMPSIAVLEGDGVGPELCGEALKTLETLKTMYNLSWNLATFPCGAAYWQAHREEWPAEARDFCTNQADAILFGSVGLPGVELPGGGLAGIGVVFGLRQGLDLYASVRPVELLADIPGNPYRKEDIKLLLVREATEGLYSGLGGVLKRGQAPEVATDVRVITASGASRIAEFALTQAERRRQEGDDRAITCIDKSNVLTGCRLFRQMVTQSAAEFPEIKLKYAYVDNFALDVLKRPQDYGVCVTSNSFGDILADLMAHLEGGTGMAATGNYGIHKAMFEPLHGPLAAARGKDAANPVAIHRCLVMLLDWLGERYHQQVFTTASRRLMDAIRQVVQHGKYRTPDIGGSSRTSDVCQAIRDELLNS